MIIVPGRGCASSADKLQGRCCCHQLDQRTRILRQSWPPSDFHVRSRKYDRLGVGWSGLSAQFWLTRLPQSIPKTCVYDANATPPQFTDHEGLTIEPGTHIRLKLIGIRTEVTEMWAVGTINEDYLGYFSLIHLNIVICMLTRSTDLWRSKNSCFSSLKDRRSKYKRICRLQEVQGDKFQPTLVTAARRSLRDLEYRPDGTIMAMLNQENSAELNQNCMTAGLVLAYLMVLAGPTYLGLAYCLATKFYGCGWSVE